MTAGERLQLIYTFLQSMKTKKNDFFSLVFEFAGNIRLFPELRSTTDIQ